jgi:hypothetical protein
MKYAPSTAEKAISPPRDWVKITATPTMIIVTNSRTRRVMERFSSRNENANGIDIEVASATSFGSSRMPR